MQPRHHHTYYFVERQNAAFEWVPAQVSDRGVTTVFRTADAADAAMRSLTQYDPRLNNLRVASGVFRAHEDAYAIA